MSHQRKRPKKPSLDEDLILSWADAHHARHGVWPNTKSGPVDDQPGETWAAIRQALTLGYRGLLPGSSLSLLLQDRRGVYRHKDQPAFTEDQILVWADSYLEKYGRYPIVRDGAIEWAANVTWAAVNCALRAGVRGLPGNSSLAKLLLERRGRRSLACLPDLSIDGVLAWMDDHYTLTGTWPTKESGVVAADPSEQWAAVDAALRNGLRSLPGGTSLIRMAIDFRGREDVKAVPPLSIEQVVRWMQAHTSSCRRYPTKRSGAIDGAPGETWAGLDSALRFGQRGLPGGQSVAKLRNELIKGGRLPAEPPSRRMYAAPLSLEQIAVWMQAYVNKHGRYPSHHKREKVDGAAGENWGSLQSSLNNGYRGLPGGQSLASLREQLIAEGKLPVLPNRRQTLTGRV